MTAAANAAHARVSTALTALDDDALSRLLAAADDGPMGIGGRCALLTVAGVPVFAKRVPLTATERAPGFAGSTADPYGLPPTSHYGVGTIGGAGYTAWRELAAHELTSGAVLAGRADAFPLLYHWRVLPETDPYRPADLADTEAVIAHWGGHPGIRRRHTELARADASVVLFLERLPFSLLDWLNEQLRQGGSVAEAALATTERGLLAALDQLETLGLLHFDGHSGNVLTDGERILLTDFGLAGSADWQPDAAEAAFLAAHADYDRTYVLGQLPVFVLHAHGVTDPAERTAVLRACAAGSPPPPALPEPAARIVTRYAVQALAVATFTAAFRADVMARFAPDAPTR